MIEFPQTIPALRVEQPIGVFYVAVIPARVLLQVAYSDNLSAASKSDGEDGYLLDGTQRLLQQKRLQAIAEYINREDAAFPNSIILAANFRKDDGLLEDDESDDEGEQDVEGDETPTTGGADRRWTVEEHPDGTATLTIPTQSKLAAIIDGQHRLFAFVESRTKRLDMNLLCSIFLDLAKPYQAQLFATINSTQKPVDKSLTYELFGYNVEEESESYWTPDKLAVFLTRKLATDEKSPLRGRIVVAAAPKKDEALAKLTAGATWKLSTAVVVEGVMRLFTSNPKKDTALLLDEKRKQRTALAPLRKDRSPLRDAYLKSQDSVIYTMVINYLSACQDVFWSKAGADSFIVRTVGVQALFDVLRKHSAIAYEVRDISAERFIGLLAPAANIDFADDEFRSSSGSGRSAIRNAILAKISQESIA